MFEEEHGLMSEARRPTKVKKAFQDHLNALMLSAVAFIIVFMLTAALTKITVDAELNFFEVSFQTALLYACTVSVHLILRSYARRKGRETEKWKIAHDKVSAYGREIVERGLVKFTSEYCRAWEDHDLEELRKRILAEVGLTMQDYAIACMYGPEELKEKFPSLTKEQRKAIIKAKKVKRLHYDEHYLSVKENIGLYRHSPSGGMKSKTVVRINTASVFLTSGIASLFSVYLTAEIIVNPTLVTIVLCCVKLVVMAIFATFGIINGYNHSAVREVGEFVDRADEQNRFIKWCEIEKAVRPAVKTEENIQRAED